MAELEDIINQPSESERRYQELSGRVRSTAEERDTARAAQEAAEAKTVEAERKAAFAEGFVDVVVANPAAKEFKDEIQSKVMGGYTVEDATFAVLGKAGKLGTPAPAETPTIAGGSSATTPAPTGTKSISEMSTEEKRAALVEAEARGDISFQ